MKIKNKFIILFLFILFLFLFNTNCLADDYTFSDDYTLCDEQDFINYVDTYCADGMKYPFSWTFNLYLRRYRVYGMYGNVDYEFDNCKYRIFYIFPTGENTAKVYFIYSNEEIKISYEYGESTPFFRTDSSSNIDYILYDVTWWNTNNIGNNKSKSNGIVNYNALTGFYISNYNIKDSKNKTVIYKSEAYNLLTHNLGGYFVRVAKDSYDMQNGYANRYYCHAISQNSYEYDNLFIFNHYCYANGSNDYRFHYVLTNESILPFDDTYDLSDESKYSLYYFPYPYYDPVSRSNFGNISLGNVFYNSCENLIKDNFHIIGGKFNTEPTDEPSKPDNPINPDIEYTGEDYVLYLTDQNLGKRFTFDFHIPKVRDDTKFYCFLDTYERYTFDSVYARFTVYTVTTPERLRLYRL